MMFFVASFFKYKNGCYYTEYGIICTVTDGNYVWVPVYHCVYASWCVCLLGGWMGCCVLASVVIRSKHIKGFKE